MMTLKKELKQKWSPIQIIPVEGLLLQAAENNK